MAILCEGLWRVLGMYVRYPWLGKPWGTVSSLNGGVNWLSTAGRKLTMASIAQFQKGGSVPNLALTVGTERVEWQDSTSGRFLHSAVPELTD